MVARSVSLRQLRLSARVPRTAVIATCVITSLAVVAGAVRKDNPTAALAPPISGRPADAEGIAQLFAVTYLGGGDSADRVRALTGLGLPEDVASSTQGGGEEPTTTAIVDSAPGRRGNRSVTVAVRRAGGTTFLRLDVARDAHGRLSVASPPAVVGPPPSTRTQVRPPEVEVEDRTMRAAAARVVRHYLAGQHDELSADLAAGVDVRPPATSFRVASVVATTWVQPSRRVAVEVIARTPGGQQLTLRYELPVVRVSGRWFVTGVDTTPHDREVTR